MEERRFEGICFRHEWHEWPQGSYRKTARFPALRPVGRRFNKKPRCNLLSQRGLRCRGDWIRTSDLLNPIQAR